MRAVTRQLRWHPAMELRALQCGQYGYVGHATCTSWKFSLCNRRGLRAHNRFHSSPSLFRLYVADGVNSFRIRERENSNKILT
jgi:hypothetical protein